MLQNKVPPLPPNTVLVRIRAAAINARDMMVIAHDPLYPGINIVVRKSSTATEPFTECYKGVTK